MVLEGPVMRKCRFSFFETLRSIESSSSGVALVAAEGEILVPATTAGLGPAGVAEGTAGTDGEDWPNTVKASAIEQRQIKNVVFIGILWSEMQTRVGLDSRKN